MELIVYQEKVSHGTNTLLKLELNLVPQQKVEVLRLPQQVERLPVEVLRNLRDKAIHCMCTCDITIITSIS